MIFYSNGVNEEVMKNFKNFIYTFCSIIVLSIIFVTIMYTYNKTQNFRIESVGHMLENRIGHSAILLPNSNEVLFVGGSDGATNNILLNAEICNFKNETCNLISMNKRHIMSDIYINSDKNIVIVDNGSIEVFDNIKKQIKLIEENPFGLDNYINETKRFQISNDIVLVSGGKINQKEYFNKGKKEQAITSKVYLYDIKNYKILKQLNLNVPRSNHQMIFSNNYLYVFGGESTTKENSLFVEKYNPDSETFEIVGKIKEARSDFSIFKKGQYIFLIGGRLKDNIEIYNLENNTSEIKKNFIINSDTSLLNYDLNILDINDENIIFIVKSRNKSLSGLYRYNLNEEKVYKINGQAIGSYANIIKFNNNLIISGGEKQFFLPLKRFKICAIGNLCPYNSATNKIILVKEK